jgi:hypothetical protein
MSKHEAPPFRMVVERGKLVPATAYDAERLDTYRRGTKVFVRFTEEKDRIFVRKWWAVLSLVVEQCDVPWQNKEQASEAIKLALGIVNLTKTVGGDYLAYPKSLTELTDPELVEAVEQMMELVQRISGVDPETLGKEIADVGADEQEHATEVNAALTESSEATGTDFETTAVEVGASSAVDRPATEAAHEDAAGSSAPSLSNEDRAWLVKAAKMLIASAEPNGDPDIVRRQYAGLIKSQTPAGISQFAIAKAVSISKHLVGVCEATVELDFDLVAGIAGCDPEAIRP